MYVKGNEVVVIFSRDNSITVVGDLCQNASNDIPSGGEDGLDNMALASHCHHSPVTLRSVTMSSNQSGWRSDMTMKMCSKLSSVTARIVCLVLLHTVYVMLLFLLSDGNTLSEVSVIGSTRQ